MPESAPLGAEGDLGSPWDDLAGRATAFARTSATDLGLSAAPLAFEAAGRALAVRCRELCRLGAVSPRPGRPQGEQTSPAAALAQLARGLPEALGKLLAGLGSHYESATAELLARLAADLPSLCSSGAGLLMSLRPGMGDPHDNGRTVTAVELSSGCFFYKPRSPAPELALAELCRLLAADEGQALAAAPVATGGPEWFWQPRIATTEPQPEDRSHLARAVGSALCLFSFLGASDFGAENVLVAGRSLVVVDAETLLSPEPELLAEVGSPVAAASVAAERLARTGLFSLPAMTPPGLPDLDLGLGAAPAMSWLSCHLEAILAGYTDCHRLLHNGRRRLGAALAQVLSGLEVRLLVRDTGWYLAALEHLAARAGRRDPEAVASSARLLAGSRSHLEVSPAVAEAEMASISAGDVPRFWLRAGDGVARGPGGRRLGRVSEPLLSLLLRRLETLPAEPPAEELEAVRAGLFACQPTAGAPALSSSPGRRASLFSSPAPNEPEELTGPAVRAARGLARHLVGAGRHRSLFGLSYNRAGRLFALRPLGGELLSGTGGLAVVLTEAAGIAGDGPGDREARPLLEERARWAAAASLEWVDRAIGRPGRAVDVAEALWALSRISATSLQEDQLGGAVLTERASILAERARRLLASGRPGADPARLRAAEAALVALRATTGRRPGPAEAGELRELICHHLGGAPGAPRSGLDALQGGFLASLTLPAGLVAALESAGNPPLEQARRLPPDAELERACASRWGPPLELAFSAPARRPGEDGFRPDRAVGWLERASPAGLLFLADLALTLEGRSAPGDGSAWLAVGLAAGHRLAQRWEEQGSFFGEERGSPRFSLSAVWGEAAGVHALVRLAAPRLGPLRLALCS